MAVSAPLALYRPAAGGDFLGRNDADSVADLELLGTIGNGLPLVIRTDGRFNFGTKPVSTPYIYDRFNGTDGQLLQAYDPNWIQYGGGAGAIISSSRPRYAGNKAAYNDSTRGGFDTNHRSFPATKKLRKSYWVYADLPLTAGTSGQIKLDRVNTAANGVYSGDGTFFLSSWHPNTNDLCLVDIDTGASVNGLGTVAVVRNQWFKVDVLIDHSTPGVADGTYLVSVNNGQSTRGGVGNVLTREAGLTHLADSTILGVMLANQNADFFMRIYNTDQFLDAGWNKVVISNTATIVQTSIVEDQNYNGWSSSEISLPALNFGAIPSGHRKYLKIFDNSNTEIVSVRIV